MSPRFAQFVDPIVMHVIDLLESIDDGKQPSPERERRLINDRLRMAENELARSDGKNWELAKYALVSWIDESLINANAWSGRDWWLGHMLEWEHGEGLDRHEMFFVKAKEAANLPGADDALETYYVCAMMGFHGFYGDGSASDSESIRLRTQEFNLPPDLTSWSSDIAGLIQQRHAQHQRGANVEAPEHIVATATPMWGRARLLWPWLLATLLLAIYVIWIVWLKK